MFRNSFFHKNTVGESEAPSLVQKKKSRSAKPDVLKVLFPGIGKITNRYEQYCIGKHSLQFIIIIIIIIII